jgi:A/G-specific adenine glycosylase
LWEGLGYYNRCKNLLFSARKIVKENKGQFPNNYEALLELKGVGPYTAAAIASFAFNLPYAVVDGNVFRVLARFFGNHTAIDSTKGKALFAQLANEVLDKKKPGLFNQAIMDFGATVCKPALPLCNSCVLHKYCKAYINAQVNQLPVKEKLLTKKSRWFTYFLLQHKQTILVSKRTGNDIWQSLNEFYLLETEENIHWTNELVNEWLKEQFGIEDASINLISEQMSQQLTHQKIKGQFIKIDLKAIPIVLKKHDWLPLTELKKLAFPKFINQFL